MKSSCRLIARQTQQKMFQGFQRNFTARDVQMLQAQAAGEKLLKGRWNFFSFLRSE